MGDYIRSHLCVACKAVFVREWVRWGFQPVAMAIGGIRIGSIGDGLPAADRCRATSVGGCVRSDLGGAMKQCTTNQPMIDAAPRRGDRTADPDARRRMRQSRGSARALLLEPGARPDRDHSRHRHDAGGAPGPRSRPSSPWRATRRSVIGRARSARRPDARFGARPRRTVALAQHAAEDDVEDAPRLLN